MKHLLSAVVLCAFMLTGCATTITNPDGTVSITEVDYMGVQLMASASVAAWAASSKNGISKKDAETVVRVLDIVEEFHLDGSEINPLAWSAVIQKEVKDPRYQALAVVVTQLIAYQLAKYHVSTTVPTAGNVAGKIMKSIRTGVLVAIAPYMSAKA